MHAEWRARKGDVVRVCEVVRQVVNRALHTPPPMVSALDPTRTPASCCQSMLNTLGTQIMRYLTRQVFRLT